MSQLPDTALGEAPSRCLGQARSSRGQPFSNAEKGDRTKPGRGPTLLAVTTSVEPHWAVRTLADEGETGAITSLKRSLGLRS